MKRLIITAACLGSFLFTTAQTEKPANETTVKELDGFAYKITMTRMKSDMSKDALPSHDTTSVPATALQDNQTDIADHNVVDYSEFETVKDKRIFVSFDNGNIISSLLTQHGLTSCPYNINSSVEGLITFSSVCKNNYPPVVATWAGTVSGNTVKGKFSWSFVNGKVFEYSFAGTKATRKELDKQKELGKK